MVDFIILFLSGNDKHSFQFPQNLIQRHSLDIELFQVNRLTPHRIYELPYIFSDCRRDCNLSGRLHQSEQSEDIILVLL